jgi:hypothetical protein
MREASKVCEIRSESDQGREAPSTTARHAFVVTIAVVVIACTAGPRVALAEYPGAANNVCLPELAPKQEAQKPNAASAQPAVPEAPLVIPIEVVDAADQPLAEVDVFMSVLYSGGPGTPATITERRSTRSVTKAEGRVQLAVPPARPGEKRQSATIWAYQPGRALGIAHLLLSEPLATPAVRFTLGQQAKRVITVHGPDDEPLAGIRVTASMFLIVGPRTRAISQLPDELLEPLTMTTDAKGVASPGYLPLANRLLALRVAGPNIAPQVLPLDPEDAGDITLKLGRPGRLVGIVRSEDGKPLAGVAVEVWVQGGGTVPGISTSRLTRDAIVQFGDQTVKTGSQGAFQTPLMLLPGSNYRITVRQEGFEPFVSGWLTLNGERALIPDIHLNRLHTIAGAIKDRQGQPVVGARVFVAGATPTAVTDAAGRFTVAGVRGQRTVMLAEQSGFRLHGWVVDPSADQDLGSLTLVRTDEAPGAAVKPIADPLPADELRTLAYRLLEPLLQDDPEIDDAAAKRAKLTVLATLGTFDVGRALEILRKSGFPEDEFEYRSLQSRLAAKLAEKDPAAAEAMVEAIPDLYWKAIALIDLVKALPANERVRKLALLEQASALFVDRLKDKNADVRLRNLASCAAEWQALSERERARSVVQAGKPVFDFLARTGGPYSTFFPAEWARVQPLPVIEWMQKLPKNNERGTEVAEVAAGLAFEHPALCEQAFQLREPGSERTAAHTNLLRMCRRLARIDPPRARRIAASIEQRGARACALAFVALGLADRGNASAAAVMDESIRTIDQIRQSGPGPVNARIIVGVQEMFPTNPAAVILPIVEQVAPDRLDDVFWRAVALHPRLESGRDDQLRRSYLGFECMMLSHYDRAVAAVLFEPMNAYLNADTTRKAVLTGIAVSQILGKACVDPHSAVAYLESLGLHAKFSRGHPTIDARRLLAEVWGLPPEQRWKRQLRTVKSWLPLED